MKKIYGGLLALVAVFALFFAVLPAEEVRAETLISGDYEYEVTASSSVTITGYNGSAASVAIPSSLAGKKVVSIAGNAFASQTLQKVTIPDSVQTVEAQAFYRCYYLTEVTVQGKDTLIGDQAFSTGSDITFICSSDSKAYSYAKENQCSVSLTDGIDLSAAKITLGTSSLVQGDTDVPSIKVTLGGKTLKEGTDYTCTWPSVSERGTVGTKKVTVTAVAYNSSNYTGSKSATYKVLPAAPAALQATKKITTTSIQLKWSTVEGASGYKIYRYSSSAKKYKAVKTISKQSTSTWKDTGLKKNTKYRYRIRAYKKVDGKTYLSAATGLTAYTASGKSVVSSKKSAKVKTNTVKLKTAVTTMNYDGIYYQGNWAMVSEISDFIDYKGRYTIAYSSSKYVYISILNNSSLKVSKTLKIKKKYSEVGSVVGDDDGNYYIVWGQTNWESGKVVLAVSKYNKNGKFVKSCSLYNTGDSFDTAVPFDSGNCAVTFQGDLLVCSYARQMNNVHQSNDVFCVNTKTMKVDTTYSNYVSHSFDQRVLALSNGDVLFANLGDGYSRGFDLEESGAAHSWSVTPFHFYGASGYNTTYARLGGVGEVSTGIVLVGTSAPSMTKKASEEKQQLFLQIISPVTGKSILSGSKRSGTSAGSSYTDTGILWLTDYEDASVSASSVVVMEKDQILVIWEKTSSGKITSYYKVLSATGKTLQKTTKIGNYSLNECEEIKYSDGCLYWTTADGTKTATVHKLYVGKFK